MQNKTYLNAGYVEMKLQFLVVAMLFAILLVFANINIAQAQWSAITSGYAVTTNWHGEDVPLGQLVTATAGTTDPSVKSVEFRWLYPNGTEAWNVRNFTLLTSPYPPPNVPQEVINYQNSSTIWYTQNAQTPDEVGNWTVQTIFHDTGRIRGQYSDIVRIRATSFFAIPEVPFGTVAILLSTFAVLGVYLIKRKRFLIGTPL